MNHKVSSEMRRPQTGVPGFSVLLSRYLYLSIIGDQASTAFTAVSFVNAPCGAFDGMAITSPGFLHI